jgi:hypothetical protein
VRRDHLEKCDCAVKITITPTPPPPAPHNTPIIGYYYYNRTRRLLDSVPPSHQPKDRAVPHQAARDRRKEDKQVIENMIKKGRIDLTIIIKYKSFRQHEM